MKDLEGIGIVFILVRKAQGMKQYEMASSLGVSQGTLSKVERGKMPPCWEMIPDLMKLYGVKLDEFYVE